MGVLTEEVPKPMLLYKGKTLLEHKFDILPADVDHIILVVGYRAEVVRAAYAEGYQGRRVSFVEQQNSVGGTADALWSARPMLTDRFLVLMGDDLYAREDIERCRGFDWALLVQHVPDVSVGGHVVLQNDVVSTIVEHKGAGEGLVSTNMFMLDTRLFSHPPVPKAPGSSELGLPQTVLAASAASGIPLHVVRATYWKQITAPADLI